MVEGLCGTSNPVPASVKSVRGMKYQPKLGGQEDYDAGDRLNGWRCLMFAVNQPQYYQYRYRVGGMSLIGGADSALPYGLDNSHRWSVTATGDLDGDGVTSLFVLEGYINSSKDIVSAPAIGVVNPTE
jgi:hypothetical protein